MAPEEREHLFPRVLGLRGTVAVGVREVQERVAGALVAMELVRLALAREIVHPVLDERVQAGAVHDHDDAGCLRGAGGGLRIGAHHGCPFSGALCSAPSFMITRSAWRSCKTAMSASGSPSTSSRSASAPGLMTPSSPGLPMSSPPRRVAATSVSMAEKPRILTKIQRSRA